jgi:hypothetical protein
MKTVYVLWNYDEDVPIFAAENRSLVEEVMYDCYYEDSYYDFCWKVASPYTRNVDAEDLPEYANMAHEDTMDWYDNYMSIIEIPVVN